MTKNNLQKTLKFGYLAIISTMYYHFENLRSYLVDINIPSTTFTYTMWIHNNSKS